MSTRPLRPTPVPRGPGLADAAPRPEAADALELARASFRRIVNASPDLVVVHREARVVLLNPAARRALGLSPADVQAGISIADLFHPDDPGRESALGTTAPDPAFSSETKECRAFNLRWRRGDGTYFPTEASAVSVDVDGRPAVAVVARDLSERSQLQHQLLQRDRMAALGTLSAGVAHEINNPLTYLLVNLEHVLRRLRAASASNDPTGELTGGTGHGGLSDLAQSLQHAVEGANRVRQIVRDLLTFTQGNIERKGMIDVRGIVESATQMAWHEIRHRARLVKSLAEVPPIEGNEARLGQVFLHLLVNAAQAIPEGHADQHEVRVSTRVDDHGNVVVEVSDTGVGIAPEHLPRVFDPFFTTKGDGTGLGLAISHGTVKSHGGDITVTSEPGQKTTFRVILRASQTWRTPVPSSSHDVHAVPRRRVLVIDDERLVGEAIARSLSDENEVDVVTDAKQALARIEDGHLYDLVLCDLLMPAMTGMDLYAELVRRAPQLVSRIVFMTGGAFTPRARAFLESVVNPSLEKPLDMGRLRSLVARAGVEKSDR